MKRRTCTAVACALLCFAANGCSRPTVENITMDIERLDFDGIQLAFLVDVSNPLPLDLNIPAGRYAVDIAGAEFIKSDDVPPANLPSGGIGQVSLPAVLNYRDIYQLARGLAGKTEIPFELSGSLSVPVAGQELSVPFKHSGDIPVLQVPKIDVEDVRLEGLFVAIDAELSNPNAFALGLERLGYAVKIGDIELGSLQASTLQSIEGGGSGKLTLKGGLSGAGALSQLLKGDAVGAASIRATGQIETPFGPVKLP